MTSIESLPVGLNGLALAWESVAVLVGAVALGLVIGLAARSRSARRRPEATISSERERELESLRRIAVELARTSDVEGVARALLDEIGSLFSVEFVALAFVSDDAREASGFLARANGKDVGWWPDVRVERVPEPTGIELRRLRRERVKAREPAPRGRGGCEERCLRAAHQQRPRHRRDLRRYH
jgi:hypothetical protein